MSRVKKEVNPKQATLFIIGVNVILYAVVAFKGITGATLVEYGGMYPAVINLYHEFYRFITAGFLHTGPVHLMMNMWAIMATGFALERLFGSFRLLAIYLASILLGNLSSYAFNSPFAISVGASSGVFGLFGVVVLLAYLFPNDRSLKHTARQFMFIILLNLVLNVFSSDIDYFAHVGGLVGGLLSGYMLSLNTYHPFKKWGIFLVYVGICALLFLKGYQSMVF